MVSFVFFCVQLFWWFWHKPSEKYWAISPKAKHKISKRRWVRSKNVFLSAALLFSLVVTKENCFENFLRSLYVEQYVFFCSNAKSRFSRTSFRTLCSVLWLFTSCVWDVLRYRILIKTAFDFFGNVISFVLYCMQLFWCFSHKPSEKYWAIPPKAKHKISKKTLSTFQKCLLELCFAFFFGCN